MKPWLKKITSAASVFALSASMIAANITAVVAEEGDLGEIDGDPIVSITHLSATKQADAISAEEKALQTLTGGETVTAVIELETPGVIEAGYTPGTAAAAAYAEGLKAEQSAKNAQIEAFAAKTVELENKTNGLNIAVPALNVEYSYVNVMNGFAVEIPFRMLPLIRNLEGVKSVFVSRTYDVPETTAEPNMYTSTTMISSDLVNYYGYSGEGTLVGVLDTGCDVAHEAFANAPENAKITGPITSDYLNAKGTTYVSEKIPFAYDYADVDNDVYPTRSNHGNHVAGTVAGKTVNADGEVTFNGVAPEAQLAIFKVFSDQRNGARDADILAALEDVVIIVPDVINLSLGSPAGFTSDIYTGEATMEDAYNRVYENGTILAISAGNEYYMGFNHLDGSGLADAENPNTGIVGSPSTYSGPTSVASIENINLITDYFVVDGNTIMYSDTAETDEQKFSSLNESAPLEFVLVPGYGEEADFEGLDVEGKIAVISRGSTTFVSKQLNAEAAGAIGAVIYNNQPGTISMQIQKGSIPCIAITLADAQYLLNSESGVISELGHDGVFANDEAWEMSDFSSWGVTDDLTLKPEITTPGGHIYSALPGNSYGDMSGTSMAAPHLAGLAAIGTQYIDELFGNDMTELQKADLVNSFMMSTATPVPYGDSDTLYYSPRKQGAGLANAGAMLSSFAYLTVDGTEGNRPKIELGDDPSKTGRYQMSFTVNNWTRFFLGYEVEVVVQTDEVVDGKILPAPHALSAVVTGADPVTVTNGGSRRLNITVELTDESKAYLDANYPNGGFVDGFIILRADGAPLTEEGLANIIDLSIPFVGFYGDWDAAPYLDETLENVENAKIAGTGASTVFGYVNDYSLTGYWPFIGQNFYDPEWDYFAQNVNPDHSTISSDSEYRIYVDILGPSYAPYLAEDETKNVGIWYLTPALLRGATWWSVDIRDADTGEEYFHDEYTENLSKYYDQADGVISGGMIYLGWGAYNQYTENYDALPEGTNIELTLNVAGAQNSRVESQKMYFTIDNTAPAIKGYSEDHVPVDLAVTRSGKKYLMFTASDNYYLAGVDVLDAEGNYIYGDFFYDDEAGVEHDFMVDVTDYEEDDAFDIILHDYTEYQTSYTVSADAGLVITPANRSYGVGSEVKFSVKDSNGFAIDAADVEWTVEGAESDKTAISADGVLTIGEDETAKTLAVYADYGTYTGFTTVTVLQYYNVELETGEGGTAKLSASGKVLENTRVTLTVTPDNDHEIGKILINNEEATADSRNRVQFVVTGDTAVKVTFNAYPEIGGLSLTYDEPLYLGVEGVLTAVAEGGKAPLQYKFTRKGTVGWTTVQDYSTNAEWTWTPDVLGTTRVCVYVKDARGVETKQVFNVTVEEPVEPLALTVEAPKTAKVGEEITIKAVAEGGKAALQYKMTAKVDGKWVEFAAYSENPEFTWSADAAGSYKLCVYVKDAKGDSLKETITVKVSE